MTISKRQIGSAGSMPRNTGKARPGGAKRGGAVKRQGVAPDAANSRERLLHAARLEFAAEGLRGARVDVIARRAKINKQLIYYHFGDKDGLYLAVLEHAYAEIRQKEHDLHLSDDEPVEAMRKLIGFTFDYDVEHRE